MESKLIGYNKRESNIELLRIFAMLIITFHHFAVHGGFTFGPAEVSFNHFWWLLLKLGGKIGVDIFVIISGYFLVTSKKQISVKKILKLIGEMVFYSITIYSIFLLTKKESFDAVTFIKQLMPTTFGAWWFASTYIVLYILHPFLNILLNTINKKTYQSLLIVLVILFSIIPTFTGSDYTGSNLMWFITLYVLAGYIRIYGLSAKLKQKNYFIILLISFIITYGTSIASTFIVESTTYLYGQSKITTLVSSVSIFMLFKNLNIKYSKFINIISSTTFGVYLIHDNDFLREYLWIDLIKNNSYQDSNLFFLISIGFCLLVFIICSLIDLVRQYTIEKAYLKLLDIISYKLHSFANKHLKSRNNTENVDVSKEELKANDELKDSSEVSNCEDNKNNVLL